MPELHARDRTAIHLMLDAGLRAGETVALQWLDIDAPRALIHVHRGKGARDRTVPITYDVMRELLADRAPSAWPIYNKLQTESPILKRALQKAIEEIADRLQIHIHCHKLRHTYATTIMRAGMNLRDVQLLLGHSSLEWTAIYTHVDADDLADRLRQNLASPPQLTFPALEMIA